MSKQQAISPTSCPEGMSLSQWQIQLRAQAARKGGFAISEIADKNVPGSFAVTNPKTRRNYRVVYHGLASSWNSCDCMDYRTNGQVAAQLGHRRMLYRWSPIATSPGRP